jgi:hypothetical protein
MSARIGWYQVGAVVLGLVGFICVTKYTTDRRFEALEASLVRTERAEPERGSEMNRIPPNQDYRTEPPPPVPASRASAEPPGEAAPEPAEPEPALTLEDRAAYVESVYFAQSSDVRWAREAEAHLTEQLSTRLAGTSKLELLECRETLCKARLQHEDGERLSEFFDRLLTSTTELWKGEIVSYRDADSSDGLVRNSIYFARVGREMPNL